MDIRYVLACCTDMALGDSRKYPWPYMYTDGFSEFWGQGGFFELEIQEHWGYLRLEFRRHWGGFRSGISTGERWECIPWKRLFYWLNQFANKARTDNHAAMATEDKHPLISNVFIWYSFVEENQQKVGFTSSSRKTCCKTSFFLSWKQPLKLVCPFDAKHVLLTEDAISSFKPRRLKFKMAEIKIHILVISSECTKVHHNIF